MPVYPGALRFAGHPPTTATSLRRSSTPLDYLATLLAITGTSSAPQIQLVLGRLSASGRRLYSLCQSHMKIHEARLLSAAKLEERREVWSPVGRMREECCSEGLWPGRLSMRLNTSFTGCSWTLNGRLHSQL